MSLFFAVIVGVVPAAAAAADSISATLSNGLRVVIVHNALTQAVAVQVNYLAGSNESPPDFPGMAHAQEHMMFRGSAGVSADQMSTIIAALGGEYNADTQQTVTQYLSTVAVEDLDIVLKMEADRMKSVLDDQRLWEEERGAIIQEVEQDVSSPLYRLSMKLQEKVFAGTPYAYDALGTRQSFEQTTAAMIKGFYRDWYAPNNAVLVIVGNVDLKSTLQKVKRIFQAIPSRPVANRPEIMLKAIEPAFIELESNLPYGLAVVAYRLPGFQSGDFAAGQVLADVLNSQRGELYGLVPAGKALFAGFEALPLPKAGAGYAMVAYAGKDAGNSIDTIKGIINQYLKNGFPAELVEAAKRREVADAEFLKTSLDDLASAWSQAVAIEGRKSPGEDIEAIKRVTAEDVNRVARRYLASDTAVTAIMAPRPSGKPATGKQLARETKESFTPQQVTPKTLPSWARKLSRSLPDVPKQQQPAVSELPNGLNLIVVTTNESQAVSVYGKIKSEPALQTPPGKEGVDDVLEQLLTYGTKKLDRLQFQAALDDIAADASIGKSFSLRVLKEHLDRGLGLLADNLLHPALPEEAFTIVRRQTAEAVAGELQSAGWQSRQALKEALYPANDPVVRHPTPETIESISLRDVGDYYHKVFRPDLATIVVIGAISADEAQALVRKHFTSWQASGPKPATDLPPVPDNKAITVNVPEQGRVQDEVTLEETLQLTRQHPDYYPLQLGFNILSGGFYATRFYRDLRQKSGLVYAVESFFHAGKTRSSFQVFYGCDPQNVGKARDVISWNLLEMQRKLVPDRELRQAKTLLLRRMLLDRTSADSIGNQLLEYSLLNLPMDEPIRAGKRYRSINAREVRDAFGKWIRPDGFSQVTRGPSPK